ncbi:unnamed protein product, partial [Ixodes pacificus]
TAAPAVPERQRQPRFLVPVHPRPAAAAPAGLQRGRPLRPVLLGHQRVPGSGPLVQREAQESLVEVRGRRRDGLQAHPVPRGEDRGVRVPRRVPALPAPGLRAVPPAPGGRFAHGVHKAQATGHQSDRV